MILLLGLESRLLNVQATYLNSSLPRRCISFSLNTWISLPFVNIGLHNVYFPKNISSNFPSGYLLHLL